jgi:glyoxylase-like metal-dependent hydrolase (beta-lactamase superfamily II)
MNNKLKVQQYSGIESHVNSFLISNDENAVLIDAQKGIDDAIKLVKFIKDSGKKLQCIFISHGHPDHYFGLKTVLDAFPNTKVYIPSNNAKQQAIGFANYLMSVGYMENIKEMKPYSKDNTQGFDYDKVLTIYSQNSISLDGGGTINIKTYLEPTEASDISTFMIEEANSLILSDLTYNNVHA